MRSEEESEKGQEKARHEPWGPLCAWIHGTVRYGARESGRKHDNGQPDSETGERDIHTDNQRIAKRAARESSRASTFNNLSPPKRSDMARQERTKEYGRQTAKKTYLTQAGRAETKKGKRKGRRNMERKPPPCARSRYRFVLFCCSCCCCVRESANIHTYIYTYIHVNGLQQLTRPLDHDIYLTIYNTHGLSIQPTNQLTNYINLCTHTHAHPKKIKRNLLNATLTKCRASAPVGTWG